MQRHATSRPEGVRLLASAHRLYPGKRSRDAAADGDVRRGIPADQRGLRAAVAGSQRQDRVSRRQERPADRLGGRHREPRHHLARLAHRRQHRRHRRPGQADRREGVLHPLSRGGEGQPAHQHHRRAGDPGGDLRFPLQPGAGAAAGEESFRRAQQDLRRADEEGPGPRRRLSLRGDHRRRHRQPLQRLRKARPAMSFINYSSREINCKIVYYGPGLCGKTTNLQFIYANTNQQAKGKMISLATETERTLFFDFLPLSLGEIRGFKTRFHLYTVPGQVFYDASRKLILKGVDGVVFVADSQIERMEANIESVENLRTNLQEQGYDLDKVPYVVQYNKRDLPNAAPMDELQNLLNPKRVPHFEAVAPKGEGVYETLKSIAKLILTELKKGST